MAKTRLRFKEVRRNVHKAEAEGLNATAEAAVIRAKNDHEWRTRTGTLEGGHNVVERATERARRVLWGVQDVAYAKYLELDRYLGGTYKWLRPAADQEYPKLSERIRRAIKRSTGRA